MNYMLCMDGTPEQLAFLDDIAALGAGIELGSYGLVGVQSPEDWEQRLAMHREARARFAGPLSIHGPFIGMEFGHIDHLIRDAVKRRLNLTFAAAVELRASRVVLHSGFTRETAFFKQEDAWLERNLAFWRTEIRRWADAGITVAMENDVEETPDLLVRIAEEVDNPYLGLCFDIGHQHLFSEMDAPAWVRSMGRRLIHVHLHDNDRGGDRHWAVGRGTIPFQPFYAAMRETAPDATIAVEVMAEMPTRLAVLREARQAITA